MDEGGHGERRGGMAPSERHVTRRELLPSGCRVLTVGDGDFAFSEALALARAADACAGAFVSTSYDGEAETRERYAACASGRLERVRAAGAKVICGVDATRLGAPGCPLEGVAAFDRIVFNFPLLPVTAKRPLDGSGDMILANRAMLAEFLRRAACLLAPGGRVIIASKDLYPYSWWRIEALPAWSGGQLEFLEMLPWELTEYPSLYRGPCNVNRDAAVKATDAVLFIFGRSGELRAECGPVDPAFQWRLGGGNGLRLVTPAGPFRCEVCRLAGMSSEADLEAHRAGKIHRKRESLESRWEANYRHIFAAAAPVASKEAAGSGVVAGAVKQLADAVGASLGPLCKRLCVATRGDPA